ncbi:hypothetical protein BDV09DRAFT_179024 [Aspergillus tetrazonus]
MASSDSSEEFLQTFAIDLTLDEGQGGAFHTKNPPKDPYQRKTVHEDRRGAHIKCSLLDVVHGKWSPASTESDATLVVFGFWFDTTGAPPGARIAAATITITFAGGTVDDDHPGVADLSLKGTYSLVEKEQSETVVQGHDANFGANIASAGQVAVAKKYEKVVTRQVSDATYVSGTSCMIGVDWDPENAVEWKLKENATLQTGVPSYLQAGVLLTRSTQAPFQCTVEIDSKVDVRSTIKRWFGAKPKDDPVLFHPKMKATNRLMEYDLHNLGEFDMSLVEDITFITVFDGAIKHANVSKN